MTKKKWRDLTEAQRQYRRDYMRMYMKQRYHICGKFRKQVNLWIKKSREKHRSKRLKSMRDWNKKHKEYVKEINHLKFVKKPDREIKKMKQEIASRYGIRPQIRCEVR